MRKSERRTMNETKEAIMKYLTTVRPLKPEGEYIGYGDIVKGIEQSLGVIRSRHAVAYAIEQLCLMGKLKRYDHKLHLVEQNAI